MNLYKVKEEKSEKEWDKEKETKEKRLTNSYHK